MGKQIGSPKTGGRKKGTPNKRAGLLSNILETNGIDPLSIILTKLEKLKPTEQIRVCLDLLPYMYPKRKPVEHVSLKEYLDASSEDQLMEAVFQIEERLNQHEGHTKEQDQTLFESRVAKAMADLEREV